MRKIVQIINHRFLGWNQLEWVGTVFLYFLNKFLYMRNNQKINVNWFEPVPIPVIQFANVRNGTQLKKIKNINIGTNHER
jgi:hypothetical protein